MALPKLLVVGAGMGGLSAAAVLAARGLEVCVLEKERVVGGKARALSVAGAAVESGPTVLTMLWALEAAFREAGACLHDHASLRRAEVLGRHAWGADQRLDLHADLGRTTQAIGELCGAREAAAFGVFAREAERTFRTLKGPWLERERPGPIALARRIGLHRLDRLFAIRPYETLWGALAARFRDPRLRQLFGRYATYCGSSPFLAPATLMLVAHVEQEGVWLIEGGVSALAQALRRVAQAAGAAVRTGAQVSELLVADGACVGVRLESGEELHADSVVFNGDPAALQGGLLGEPARSALPAGRGARSLSALTWSVHARAGGFPLERHNVFFSGDSSAEFADLFARARLPANPTVYVCAQDRPAAARAADAPERLLVVVNAPALGDGEGLSEAEIRACEMATFQRLEACGLQLDPQGARTLTTPREFHRLFPGTGGALYGMASHGWAASFRRPSARTRLRNLYLAGGATHPGPGAPMAALSGRIAAHAVIADLASTRAFHPVATPGGISTPSATMVAVD